jgi:tetratricopeptide (TPR) repeat protein
LVTKAALLDIVWPEVTVSDSMPAISIKELRKALGDRARSPRFIETVPRRGYRFIADVTTSPVEETMRELVPSPKPIVVGRKQELLLLQSWYAHVLGRRRRVVFVTGESGIGKSTFVQAFIDSIAAQSAVLVARGQCLDQYRAGEPYMPILEALTRLCQGPGGHGVVEVLSELAPTWVSQMPGFLKYSERAPLQRKAADMTQRRMLREMTQAMEAITAEATLILLLEDLQWSDFSTLELISAIARRSEPARLFIVATYRTSEMLVNALPLRTLKEELELHGYCDELQLKLLDSKEVANYLARRFSGIAPSQSDRIARIVYKRSEGNPLFMVNVADYLVEPDLISSSREGEGVGLADRLCTDHLDAPRSICRMIERNFERLRPEEQAALEGASVVGPEFSSVLVAAALERPQTEIEECCTRLARHEQFVTRLGTISWPDGTVATAFRFHHALYQEVLYSRLSAKHRSQLHERVARREEEGYGEIAEEVASELGRHYRLGNVKSKAIKYFQVAGNRAVSRDAMVEAEAHYRNALALLAELPKSDERDCEELALQMALGNVLWSSKSWSHPEVGRVYRRARELSERQRETGRMLGALHGLVVSALGNGQFKLARELAEQMLGIAERSGDGVALCAAHTRLGQTLIWRAQFLEAQKHVDLGISYYDEGDRSELGLMGIDAPALAAIAALLRGYPDHGRQLVKEAFRRSARRNDVFWKGVVHTLGSMFFGMLLDSPAVLEHSLVLRSLAVVQPVWTGPAESSTGEALMIRGNWEEGISHIRKASAFYKSVGLLGMCAWQRLREVEFFVRTGRIDEGLALVSVAVADSEELAQIRSPALRHRADLLAQSDADPSAIETAYRSAIECARSQNAKYYELQAVTHFAKWLKSQGQTSEASTRLAEIYHWFTEGFDTPALTEAKALLR